MLLADNIDQSFGYVLAYRPTGITFLLVVAVLIMNHARYGGPASADDSLNSSWLVCRKETDETKEEKT